MNVNNFVSNYINSSECQTLFRVDGAKGETEAKATVEKVVAFVKKSIFPLCDQIKTEKDHSAIEALNDKIMNLHTAMEKIDGRNIKTLNKSLGDLYVQLNQKLFNAYLKLHPEVEKKIGVSIPANVQAVVIAQKTSPKPNSAKNSLGAVQERIQKLDLGSASCKKEINELIADINKILPQEPALQAVKESLKLLIDPHAFTCDAGSIENHILEGFVKNLPGFKTEYNPSILKSSSAAAKSDLLRFLKKSDLKSQETIEAKIKSLRKEAQLSRLSSLTIRPIENEKTINNLQLFIETAEEVEQEMTVYVNNKINTLHKNYATKNEKFNNLIKHYGYCNLENNSNEYIKMGAAAFLVNVLKKINPAQFAKLQAIELKQQLQQINQEQRAEARGFVLDIMKEKKGKYDWLFKNADHIEKPYNQGDDKSRNVGGGTCLRNSLERLALLLLRPETTSNQIEMGSTEEGRIVQLKVNHGLLRDEDKQIYRKLGLTQPQINEYAVIGRIGDEVVAKLFQSPTSPIKQGGVFILGMTNNDSGHAMNLQFDPKKNIFRFIDDNLGIAGSYTQEEFIKEFPAFLNTYYPEYNSFEIWSLSVQDKQAAEKTAARLTKK